MILTAFATATIFCATFILVFEALLVVWMFISSFYRLLWAPKEADPDA